MPWILPVGPGATAFWHTTWGTRCWLSIVTRRRYQRFRVVGCRPCRKTWSTDGGHFAPGGSTSSCAPITCFGPVWTCWPRCSHPGGGCSTKPLRWVTSGSVAPPIRRSCCALANCCSWPTGQACMSWPMKTAWSASRVRRACSVWRPCVRRSMTHGSRSTEFVRAIRPSPRQGRALG